MPESVRLVKKYPNRRLYDTKTSAYITLVDVKGLVLAHERFRVVDARSGDDLTRSILMQIILDEEGAGVPLFSADLLSQMIRFYGRSTQGVLGQYLEANIKAFAAFQKKGDMSSALTSFQGAAMQTVNDAGVDQSRKRDRQVQDPLKNQIPGVFSTRVAIEVGEPDKSPK